MARTGYRRGAPRNLRRAGCHTRQTHSCWRHSYKRHLHAVFGAAVDTEEFELEFSELAAVRWFTVEEVSELQHLDQLHAGYEYDAVRSLITLLNDSS